MTGRVPLARRTLFSDRLRAALAAGGVAAALLLVLLLQGIFDFLRGGSVVMTTNTPNGRGIAQLWDTANLAPIGEPLPLPHEAYSLSRSPDGTTAVASASEGAVQIWDVGIEHWVATACRIAGRNLTQVEWRSYLPGEPYRRTCPQWPGESS